MRRILVVDDVVANRLMLQMFLEQRGFVVDDAGGGQEAVDQAALRHYDAILMDVHMPDTDGYAAARLIRAAEAPGTRTLIIAVTACVDGETRARCLAAGMDAHFTKPIELREFSSVLKKLIAGHEVPPGILLAAART